MGTSKLVEFVQLAGNGAYRLKTVSSALSLQFKIVQMRRQNENVFGVDVTKSQYCSVVLSQVGRVNEPDSSIVSDVCKIQNTCLLRVQSTKLVQFPMNPNVAVRNKVRRLKIVKPYYYLCLIKLIETAVHSAPKAK